MVATAHPHWISAITVAMLPSSSSPAWDAPLQLIAPPSSRWHFAKPMLPLTATSVLFHSLPRTCSFQDRVEQRETDGSGSLVATLGYFNASLSSTFKHVSVGRHNCGWHLVCHWHAGLGQSVDTC